MLHFIKGSSGTGKSRYITELLKSYADSGEDRILFIVPDQSSFETEKTFLELMGAGESLKIKVLGFSRICDYIHEQNGSSGKKPLDDGGKAILMELALEECRDNMPLFSNTKNRRELSRLMLKAVKEYKTCNITPQMLQKAEEAIESESLVQKLRETSLVKEVFDSLVSESYIDPDDYITLALDSLKENNLFKDHIIAMDSFSGFTKQELDFIEKLIADSREFYISLLTDNTGDRELFFTTERTCSQLTAIARNNGVKIAPDVILKTPYRFKNPDLLPIFHNAFRIVKKTCDKPVEGITLYHAANIHSECDFVARNIRRLVVQEGYMYSDISVICRDDEPYCGIIDTAFEKYEIPYFMDRVEDIRTKPLVRFITYALEAVNNSFRRESVLNMLKSGVMGYTSQQVAEFENYIYSWNISGTKFYKSFTDNPRGYATKEEESDRELLDRVNMIREAVTAPLRHFREECRGKTATEITKKLYQLLLNFNIPENLVQLCLTMEEKGEYRLSEEQRRLWDILMNILDKMIDLLGDRELPLKDYSELLLIQFNSAEIGYIPATVDEVVVSGIERVRLKNKKAVFVVGCNEGEFPAATATGGIFTDKERKLLIQHGIEINDSAEDLTFKEMYLAFYALTLAEERLFVSYNMGDLTGTEKSPSEIVGELMEIYPRLAETGDDKLSAEDSLWCRSSAFKFMAEHSNTNSITQTALKEYFLNDNEYRSRAEVILDGASPPMIKNRAVAEELYGRNIRLSASKAEQFSNCKFSYFMKYGINAKERQKNEVNALNYGMLMHYVFEQFFSKNTKAEFTEFSEEEINSRISEYFRQFLNEYLGGAENKDKGFLYLYDRMQKNALKIVAFIIESFQHSEFEPVDFELGIGRELSSYSLLTENGASVNLEGSIDRVDLLKRDGKTYVRIVDYKTGRKEFHLSDILYGKNMQMLIYLAALLRHGRQRYGTELTPAGVLYQPASAKCDASGKDIYSQLENKGLILDDEKIISYMDNEAIMRFIPIKYTKKGAINAASAEYLCTAEEFEQLFKSVDRSLKEMANALHSGDISCDPIADSKVLYCQFCPYQQVCGTETADNAREQINWKHDEVFSILKERENNATVD